jgi:uncharacterized protein
MSTVSVGEFEWDSEKAKGNFRKHGVTFDDAARAFEDPYSLELADMVDPDRIVLLGVTYPERLLYVVYTERTTSGRTRIISARKATPYEQKTYAER